MKNDLASVLKRVARTSEALLATHKELEIRTLEQMREHWNNAYEVNRWSRTKGRPKKGSGLKPAPDAVQNYASMFVAAYTLELDVLSFRTMYDLRQALNEARPDPSPKEDDQPPELKGLKITAETKQTGAFWHDTLVMWKKLPDDKKEQVVRQMQEIMRQLVEELHLELEPAA